MSRRTKFFLIHLFLCFCIAILLLGSAYLIWYPHPLAQAVGAVKIFVLILIVDVIVGPLLGFLVYKENKKSLKFDLCTIFIFQFFALGYGIYNLAEGRPSWIVYNVDQFELIKKNDLLIDNVRDVDKKFSQESWLGPQYVAVTRAKDKKQQEDDLFAEAIGGISIAQRPERYVELNNVKKQMQERAQQLAKLKKFNEASQVDLILEQYPKANAWLPLKSNVLDMVVLVNKESASIIKIVDLRPWK
ncbi:TfpX/TfpZ family type IV pilin accessory protein [Acinetobacter indicus]|uniref:TfpX/TfpZ family type IV pilin accessory protein n=1 Tax=Acinetobacter indicus TaxID=756892 RepID=UPI0014441396|nr:TfpX/TfpZ family type IV pilin accessory protein [Acinetobacter indicus]